MGRSNSASALQRWVYYTTKETITMTLFALFLLCCYRTSTKQQKIWNHNYHRSTLSQHGVLSLLASDNGSSCLVVYTYGNIIPILSAFTRCFHRCLHPLEIDELWYLRISTISSLNLSSTRPYFSDLALVKFFSGRTLVNLFSIVIFSFLPPGMSQREGFP